jgi:hypothetical protein
MPHQRNRTGDLTIPNGILQKRVYRSELVQGRRALRMRE